MSAVDDELPDAPRETPTPGPMSYAHALDTSSGSSSLSDRSMLAVTTEEDDSSHANRVPRAEEQGPGFRDGDDDDAATTVSDATTTTTTTTITDADDANAPARGGESRKKPTHRRGGARGGGSRERGGQRHHHHHHPSHLAVDEWATQSSWAAQAQRMNQYPHSAYAHAGAAAYVPIHDHRDAEPPPPGTGVLHPTSHLGRGADERPPYARTYGDDVIDPYAAAALMYGYGYANADPVLVANYTAWQLRQHAAAAAAHAAQYGGGHHAMKSQQQHGGPPGHGPGGVPMMHGGGGMMYGQPLPYGMYPGAYGPGGMGPGPDGMMMGPGGPGGPMGGPHGGPGMYAHHGGPGPFVGHAAMHDARAPHPGTVPHHAGGHHAGGHAAAGGSGPRRQYSSDLSRLMSEFNNNPGSSDDFLKSFLQRTASELDFMAQGQDSSGGTKSQGS